MFGFLFNDGLKTYTVEVYEDERLDQTLSVQAKNGFDAVDKVANSLSKPTSNLRRIKCLNCTP